MYIQSKMKTKQSPAPIRAARWTLEFFKQLSYNTDLKAYVYASTETGFVGIEYYLQGFFLKIQWYVAVPSRLDVVVISVSSLLTAWAGSCAGNSSPYQCYTQEWKNERATNTVSGDRTWQPLALLPFFNPGKLMTRVDFWTCSLL